MVQKILADCWQCGFGAYTLLGGEPLCYPGIATVLRTAYNLGYHQTVCTNGGRIREYHKELSQDLNTLLISIDAIGEKHDQLRRHPGLFRKILEGIDSLKKENTRCNMVIWSTLSRVNQNLVMDLCKLARELKIFIEFFPANSYWGCKPDLILSDSERSETFTQVIELKRKGYPITNTTRSLELIKGALPFRCNISGVSIYMLWDGAVYPCDPRAVGAETMLGRAPQLEFKNLAASPRFQKYAKELRSCNNCYCAAVVHHADNIWAAGTRRFLNNAYYHHIYSMVR